MLIEISKNGEGIFAELTKNTIVLCNLDGFKFMEKMFRIFETNQEGLDEYLYNFRYKKDAVVIENISENEFIIKSNRQLIRIVSIIHNEENMKYLETLKYKHRDIWFCEADDTYSLIAFKGHEFWNTWKKFIKGYFMGRFGGIEYLEPVFKINQPRYDKDEVRFDHG